MPKNIIDLMRGKWQDGTRPKDVFRLHVAKNPSDYVDVIIDGLSSDNARVQNGCAELASLLSEDTPRLLYPHIQLFLDRLEAKRPVLRWEAVCTLGNLAAVDVAGQLPPHIDAIARHLEDKSIVLQGHAVRALGKIGAAHPEKASGVVDLLIGSHHRFPGNRIGFVVEALELLSVTEALRARIHAFIEPYCESDIKVVAKKARRAVRKLSKGVLV